MLRFHFSVRALRVTVGGTRTVHNNTTAGVPVHTTTQQQVFQCTPQHNSRCPSVCNIIAGVLMYTTTQQQVSQCTQKHNSRCSNVCNNTAAGVPMYLTTAGVPMYTTTQQQVSQYIQQRNKLFQVSQSIQQHNSRCPRCPGVYNTTAGVPVRACCTHYLLDAGH